MVNLKNFIFGLLLAIGILAFVPITKIIVEVASFDIQAIKNPSISGSLYQQGKQAGFWNLREYILHRDGQNRGQNFDQPEMAV